MFLSGRSKVSLTSLLAAVVVHAMRIAVAYNLDTDEPIVRQGLNGDGALFGYSVAQLKDSVASWYEVAT